MPSEFSKSGKNNPCSVCNRTSDTDCRSKEQDNLIFCHTHIDDPGQTLNGYKYVSATKDDLWGIFVNDQHNSKGELRGRKIRVGEERSQFFYPARDGQALIKIEKVKQGAEKQFYQYHWDGQNWTSGMPDKVKPTIPVYRYSEVKAAIDAGQPVLVVEGESSADALWAIGIAATTFIGGAKKLHSYGKGYKADLSGADLILCPDRDKPGLAHMDEVSKLFPMAKLIRVYPKSPIWACVPDHNGLDVEDWIAEGATPEEILEAVEQSPGKAKKSAGDLRKKVERVEQEQDLFERTLLEQEVSSEYGVRGRTLGRLIEALAPVEKPPVVFLSDLSTALYQKMEERSVNGVSPGYLSGLENVDEILYGFQPSDLVILAARPSMGKTALALNFARNISRTYGVPVIFFSLEMSAAQLNYRLLSMASQVPSQRLRLGKISSQEWVSVSRAVNELIETPIAIDDSSAIRVDDIRVKAQKVITDHGSLSMIVIDYLQLMSADSAENRNAEISKISRGLKALARDLNVPVLALSQLSRSVESRSDKRPMMSDLRDSGAIEQDADVIMMLYRDEYYNPNSDDRAVAELSIVKHRNGPTGMAKLLFQKEFGTFQDALKTPSYF